MSNAAISRMRCTNLLARVSDDNIAAVEAFLALVVAGQVRPLHWDECPVCGVPNGPHQGCACPPFETFSSECDEPNPLPAARSAPNSAGRPEPSPSAPVFKGDHATSSGSTGLSTSGTTAKTSRDNAPVAAGEASPAESKGTRSFFKVGDYARFSWGVHPSDDGSMVGSLVRITHRLTSGNLEGVYVESVRGGKRDPGADGGTWYGLRDYDLEQVDPPDFDLDAATAEADCNALEDLTGPGVPDWQPVPGEQVEVVEAVGSKTGPRRAIGTFVGYEQDEKDQDGERWRLVEVYGVIRRFRAVGRVG